eukprot:6244356-Pyramimonas_sp.AAC.1
MSGQTLCAACLRGGSLCAGCARPRPIRAQHLVGQEERPPRRHGWARLNNLSGSNPIRGLG